VREQPGASQGVVERSAALVPPAYAESRRPQPVPALVVNVYGETTQPVTGTLRDWLAVHSTSAPYGSAASPSVQFYGVRNIWPLYAGARPGAGEPGGLPALLFEHDVKGLPARELLVADGRRVMGIGYTDFGSVDLSAAFQQVWQTLMVTQTQALPPGLVYGQGKAAENDLWRIDAQGRPVRILDRGSVALSPDGTHALYVEDDDIWLADLGTGQRRNLTRTPERSEMYPAWWPGRPDTIVCASRPRDATWGSIGLLTAVNLSDRAYQVLDGSDDGSGSMYGLPAPGPDGQTIAYDRDGQPMVYHWGSGPERFDPQQHGLRQAVRAMENAAWSPDGKGLAWVAAEDFGGGNTAALAVFDLAAGQARILHPHKPAMLEGFESAPVWQPGGQWLAFAVAGQDAVSGGLWALRADGKEGYNLGTGGNPYWCGDGKPVWSPDGKALAATARSLAPVIRVYDTGTWLARDLRLAASSPRPIGWLPAGPAGQPR
jgi:Tol biopolymer transport system component